MRCTCFSKKAPQFGILIVMNAQGMFANLLGILQQNGSDLWGKLPHKERPVTCNVFFQSLAMQDS